MDLSGLTINNNYYIIEKISERFISDCYLSRIINTNEFAVVKIFFHKQISDNIGELIRHRRDLESIIKLHHPNIVKILDYGDIFKLPYVVMEFINGSKILSYIKDSIPTPDMAIDIVLQIASALEVIHQSGITHQWLNPGNVIISNDDKSGKIIVRIKNTGFPNIKYHKKSGNISPDDTDYFEYLSPEQISYDNSIIDERSDLYSLGVIFFRLLTGATPYTEDEMLFSPNINNYQKLKTIELLNPSVHRSLQTIVMKLIERNKDNRYASATSLISDLKKYLSGDRNFNIQLYHNTVIPDYRSRFVGRENELQILDHLYKQIKKNRGKISLISGESGIGKTHLITEFTQSVRQNNVTVLTGKCTNNKAGEPFSLIRELLSDYIEIFREYSEIKKKEIRRLLRSSLGILGDIIIRINPDMEQVLGHFSPPARINLEQDNKRFYYITGQFFINLAKAEKTLIIVAEDLQWINEGSLEILNNIADGISNGPVLLIGSYRDEEISAGISLKNFIQKLRGMNDVLHEIKVDHLKKDDIDHFIKSIIKVNKNSAPALLDFIHTKSRGNPFFATEILKELINEKILLPEEAEYKLDCQLLNNIIAPDSVTDILLKRINLLENVEKKILSQASVIGSRFNLNILSGLFPEFNTYQFDSIIKNCIKMQLINLKENSQIVFVHDRIHEAFLDIICHEEKKLIHIKIASILEIIYRENIDEILFDLANHCIAGEDKNKTLEYSIRAAFKAAETYANNDSIRYFQISLEILNERIHSGNEEMRTLWISATEGLAKVCLTIGRYDESIDILNSLIPYTEDYIIRARSHNMVSLAFYKKGDWKLCELFAKIGLDELGEKIPQSIKSLISSIAKESFIHMLHLLLPFIFVRKNSSSYDNRKELQIMLYETLIFMYPMKNHLKYYWTAIKILNIAERHFGEGAALVVALYSYGAIALTTGFFKTAMKYFSNSNAIARKINNPYLVAVSSYYIGNCYEFSGDFNNAVELYNTAFNEFNRIGNINGAGFIINSLCSCYMHLGAYYKLKETIDKFSSVLRTLNNNFLISNSLLYKAIYYIGVGDIGMAMIQAREAHSFSADSILWMPHCIASSLIGMIYSFVNDYDSSISFYERSIELYQKKKFIRYYTIHCYPLLFEVLVEKYKNDTSLSENDRKHLFLKIKKFHKLSLVSTRKWVTADKYTLTASAKYYALTGKNKKAEKMFIKCDTLCTKYNMKYDRAKNLYEYGLFLIESGDENDGQKKLENSYNIFKEIGSGFYLEKLNSLLGINDNSNKLPIIQQFVQKKRMIIASRLSDEVNHLSDFKSIFELVVKNLQTLSGSDCIIYYTEDNNGTPIIKASVCNDGFNPQLIPHNDIIKLFFSQDNVDFKLSRNPTNDTTGPSVSILYLPVKYSERIIGICTFANSAERGNFSDDDIALIMAFFQKISWSLNYACESTRSNILKDDSKLKVTSANEEKIKKVLSYIDENYMFNISREGLATLINSNPDYFSKCFKLYTGMKINEYINNIRIDEAAKRLRNTDKKIIEIALSVGFDSLSTFNKSFYKKMKTNPTQFRNNLLNYRSDFN